MNETIFGDQLGGTGIQSASSKKKGWVQNAATDGEVAPVIGIGLAVTGNARAHLVRRSRSVRVAEGRPGERARQRVSIGKYPAANDHVPRGM